MDDRLVNCLASLEGGLQQFRLDQQSNDAKIISEIQNTASKTQSAVESGRQETLRTKEALVQHHTSLEGILKTNEDREKAQIVINSLSTGELRRRRQDVRDAHSETFNWILETEHSTLASWLRNGTGLFWIRGKAGSGKSTLMNFIVEDDRTEGLLQTWATSGQVCIAQHFFWIAETSLQKNHQGMLQDLLYQILNSDHSLVPVVCRKRWQSKNVVAQDWTTKELSDVLRAVVDQTHQHLCLFLDGLDEYFPDVEHDVLMSFLQKLASRSNVKILVSSRPWRMFESAFGHIPNRLHLEDVTQKDIFKYTRSRLISAYDHGPKSFYILLQCEIAHSPESQPMGIRGWWISSI